MGWMVLRIRALKRADGSSDYRLAVLPVSEDDSIMEVERKKITSSGIHLIEATAQNAPDPNSDAAVWPHGDAKTRILNKSGSYYSDQDINEVLKLWSDGHGKTIMDVPRMFEKAQQEEDIKQAALELNSKQKN